MKIQVYLTIGYSSADHEDELEIPDEDLEGLTPEQKNNLIDEEVREWASNYIEWGWKEILDSSIPQD